MAVITTTFSPLPVSFPFINPYGEPLQWQTGIPRSELVFSVVDQDITLAGVGDTQRVIFNCTLPTGFAYVITEGNMRITGADFADWQNQAFSALSSEATTTPIWDSVFPMPGIDVTEGPTFGNVIYTSGVTNKIVIPAGGLNGRWRWKVDNLVTNGIAMKLTGFARALVFDRNQAQQWQVNTPLPVR